ncbi:unnamed protein product [marine sediment metagenome]|uniref:Uncharacterized protein n=1 Tax=marine sediment metagenome TaxID=412755 RepID=X0RPS9_9ZZZZ
MKWIEINEIEPVNKRKTKIFEVVAKKNKDCLGTIEWSTRWRCYAFNPINSYFEEDCLRDIANFLEAETKKYKSKGK